jgi:UDP-N-acetylglucosamine acyltransferase
MTVHPTAIVDTEVPEGVEVGPYAVVTSRVSLSAGCSIGAHAYVDGPTVLGRGVSIGPSAVVGTDPQDLKYGGESTELEVGADTVIREFANINRGTDASGRTVIGERCLIMAYVHVAHDCRIGDEVILANSVQLAGHVEIGDCTIIGGVVPVHQFVRIGPHVMIGGGFRVAKDVPPFMLAGGYPLRLASLNRVGLSRRGFDASRMESLQKAFGLLFREDGVIRDKARTILQEEGWSDDAMRLAEFVMESRRGLVT